MRPTEIVMAMMMDSWMVKTKDFWTEIKTWMVTVMEKTMDLMKMKVIQMEKQMEMVQKNQQ